MIKGNFISYAQSDEAIIEERSSSVSRDKGTNPPPTNQSHNGRGKGCSKERITKEEVHHLLINPTNSNSQSDCEAKVATSAKNTGPLSRQQQSYALTERYIIDLTEDDVDSELKDLPLTQPVDTSAGKLPCGISSPLTQKAQDSSNESPLPAQSSHINFPTKENGAYHSNFHKKCDLKMSKPKTSIRALEFLESYLIQHPDACFSAITEAPVPDSDEISQAKANIQSILALSLDEVMEVDCFQKFKSSLESLLGANSLTGLQGANISNVQGKLDFVESKYRSATEVTAEVNKDFTEKIELEDKVQRYSSQFSEAQKDEQDYLTCINVQESIVEGRRKEVVEAEALLKRLTEDFVEEKAVLKRLKELLTENKARVNKSNYELEQSHQKLHNHCINEKTWVTKALQAKKDLESVAETWAQIQQLSAFIL